jgi:hypothetical protein
MRLILRATLGADIAPLGPAHVGGVACYLYVGPLGLKTLAATESR